MLPHRQSALFDQVRWKPRDVKRQRKVLAKATPAGTTGGLTATILATVDATSPGCSSEGWAMPARMTSRSSAFTDA
jgi:hypothetical protein